jgi:hypothetical protein
MDGLRDQDTASAHPLKAFEVRHMVLDLPEYL